jgi:hypothetical protein
MVSRLQEIEMRNDIDIAKDNAIKDAEMLVAALYTLNPVMCPTCADELEELEASLDDLRELVRLDKIGSDIDRAESMMEDR